MFLGSVMFSITLPSMVFFYDIVEGHVVQEAKPGYSDVIALEDIGFYTVIVAAFSVGQVGAAGIDRLPQKWRLTAGAVWRRGAGGAGRP